MKVDKLNTQQMVISSLTSIAIITLLSLTVTVLIAHIQDLEILALYFNVISGVTGALAGLYMGKRLNDEPEPNNEITVDEKA